jgi:hypothetical protein
MKSFRKWTILSNLERCYFESLIYLRKLGVFLGTTIVTQNHYGNSKSKNLLYHHVH